MSFDIILVDVNVLGLAKSSSKDKLIDAFNEVSGESDEYDFSQVCGEMKSVLDRLVDTYGTLNQPKEDCPWAVWPPYIKAKGQIATLCVGWHAGMEVLKHTEEISSNTSIAVINPQPPEPPQRNMQHSQDRFLGKIEESGLSVYVKMGSFGPMFQYGGYEEIDNPNFIALREEMKFDIDSATLSNALDIAKLPRVIGHDENGDDVLVSFGSNMPYVKFGKNYYKSRSIDPLSITLDESVKLIKDEQLEADWRK